MPYNIRMGAVLLTCFMSIQFVTHFVSSENPHNNHDTNHTISLVFLGTVDGKDFYAVAEPFRNWTEAGEYCITSGMRLASITSLEQADFLQSKRNCTLGPSYFCSEYWVGGRMIRTDLSDFAWAYNNETVVNPGLTYYDKPIFNQCLYYGTGNGGYFSHLDCPTTMGTLCEHFVEA